MQKLKLKARDRTALKTLSLAIRCGANLLPVKGMLYAMSHAKASRYVTGSQKQEVHASLQRMGRYIRELSLLASDLQRMREVSGTTFHRQLRLATISYVNVFYSMDNAKRDSYLESCVGHSRKIENEQNLLLIPAIMASRGEPKNDVIQFLSNNIYKIPFRVLYHSSKAAVHIELLEQAMGIKAAPEEEQMRDFSSTLGKLERRMQEIQEGGIKPEVDEALKQEFVEEAVDLSQTSEMKVAEFIGERVMPNAFTDRIAKRIVRKL